MKKILIANRGEIACRIINSCKKLKFHSIAVYSDVDKNSKHVKKADESIHIGGSKAQDSYLSSDKIIEAAKKVKADAIHPGYGFLAENDKFAQKVIDAGIVWIGPKPNTIVSMGNKDIARDLALKSGLPICPGLNNKDLEKSDLSFDLDMSLFEPGYAYELNFVYYLNGAYHEQPEKFKFKVE